MKVFNILREKLKEKEDYSCSPQYSKGIDDAIKAVEEAEKKYSANNGWVSVDERFPDDDRYVLLSFRNFTNPIIGRYEENEDGGAFYAGDEDESLASQFLFVNAWMELPELYKEDEIPKKQTNGDRIRSMTDEELIKHILCPYDTAGEPYELMPCVKDGVLQEFFSKEECEKCMLDWLRSEVRE